MSTPKHSAMSGLILLGALLAPANSVADGAVEETLRVPMEDLVAEEDMPKPAPSAKAPPPKGSFPEYVVRPGDVLAFRSFDDPSLNVSELMVRYDGRVSLPLIEDLEIAGFTRAGAMEAVRDAYTGAVFHDPQLSLRVVQASGQTYYIFGDVNRPGEFPYLRPMSLLQAISAAGGPRDRNNTTGESTAIQQGSLTVAYLIRHRPGGREIMRCDLRGLTQTGPHASETMVWPQDVIYVPEGTNLVYVTGAVLRPGVLSLVEGETLLQILSRASGVIESTAYKGRVAVIRPLANGQAEVIRVNLRRALKGDAPFIMRPGDIVYVPQKPLVRLQTFVNNLTGSILPLMSLYTQAYETYYTPKRYDELFEDTGDGSQTTVQLIDALQSLGNLTQTLATTP